MLNTIKPKSSDIILFELFSGLSTVRECPPKWLSFSNKSTVYFFDKNDNPLKNAPHTHIELAANEWKHKYDRETAAYPSATLKSYKYWPPVARVDNVYGDKNLFCSCPSMDEYKKETAA